MFGFLKKKKSEEELYLEADRLLYAAKERGRDQAVIGSMAEADPAAV